MKYFLLFSFIGGLLSSSLFSLDIILKKEVELSNTEVCLKDISTFINSTDEESVLLEKVCFDTLPQAIKTYTKKEIENIITTNAIPVDSLQGESVVVYPILKKLPHSVLTNYLNDKTSAFNKKYTINFGANENDFTLVPLQSLVFLDIDLTNNFLLMKAKNNNGDLFIWQKYPFLSSTNIDKNDLEPNLFDKVMVEPIHTDTMGRVSVGNHLTLIVRKSTIVIKMPVRSLESAKVGDEIRVRSDDFRKVYKAKLINLKEVEIMYE